MTNQQSDSHGRSGAHAYSNPNRCAGTGAVVASGACSTHGASACSSGSSPGSSPSHSSSAVLSGCSCSHSEANCESGTGGPITSFHFWLVRKSFGLTIGGNVLYNTKYF